jgi:hypothetical protein
VMGLRLQNRCYVYNTMSKTSLLHPDAPIACPPLPQSYNSLVYNYRDSNYSTNASGGDVASSKQYLDVLISGRGDGRHRCDVLYERDSARRECSARNYDLKGHRLDERMSDDSNKVAANTHLSCPPPRQPQWQHWGPL